MKAKNIDDLVWKLKDTGKKIPDEVKKAINSIGYRLLEQVRLGNKDEVFYLLLRCFKTKEMKFPDELTDVFKPENEAYFRTLIFSFLAPILGESHQSAGGES